MNTEICMTNWYVGKRIKEDILYNQRAEYGKQVIKKLATRLTVKYGSGWGYGKLKQRGNATGDENILCFSHSYTVFKCFL